LQWITTQGRGTSRGLSSRRYSLVLWFFALI
jgi:hypothetical protein